MHNHREPIAVKGMAFPLGPVLSESQATLACSQNEETYGSKKAASRMHWKVLPIDPNADLYWLDSVPKGLNVWLSVQPEQVGL